MTVLDLHLRCPGLIVYRGLARVADVFGRALGVPDGCVVELVLASDREIGRVHHQALGVRGPTDCIAFPLPHEGPDGWPIYLGALHLGVEEVRRNARREGHGLGREAAFVLAHGLLHLRGWEDDTPAARAAMFARQEDLLDAVEAEEGRLPRLLGFRRGGSRGPSGRAARGRSGAP